MCEVSEKIYNEGKIAGKIEGKMETAFNMKEKGYPGDAIADIPKIGLNILQQWLAQNR